MIVLMQRRATIYSLGPFFFSNDGVPRLKNYCTEMTLATTDIERIFPINGFGMTGLFNPGGSNIYCDRHLSDYANSVAILTRGNMH